MGKVTTVLDIIKDNYSRVKGNDAVMWRTTEMLSDAVLPMAETHPKEYWQLIKDLYCTMAGPHSNEDFAEWQVSEMFHKDKIGTVHKGEHWSVNQTTQIYEQIKNKIPNTYNKYDWYVVMNMKYHDYICMLKEWFPEADESHITPKVVDMSVSYLADSDSEDGKIWNYLN
ncbi:MAG: hypothetical protein ACRCX5_14530 [Bacteroidales bacterium]